MSTEARSDALVPHASVVILTLNGRPEFDTCLAAVCNQETAWPYEVLVIDSGSRDGTLEIVRRCLDVLSERRLRQTSPAVTLRLIEIPPDSFNHGGTRNLGANLARGEFVAFLTQDAIPADSHWLSALLVAFDDPAVAGAFSRQIPKSDAHVLTRRSLSLWAGSQEQRIVKHWPGAAAYIEMSPWDRYNLIIFDDVSSCLRKSVWSQIPYETVSFGEDIDWALRALMAGHALVYESASRVYHSHNRTPWYEFKRIYQDHQNLYRLVGMETVPTLRVAWKRIWRAWGGYSAYVICSNARWNEKAYLLFTYIPFAAPAQVFGQYLGRHADEFLARWSWFRHLDQVWRAGV
jgi:rhamnosyltransferase